jgi:hypothetical protein
MRKWIARLFAVLALGGAGIGIYLAVTSVKVKHDVTVSEAHDAMVALAGVNHDLSSRLGALHPGDSPRDAQETVRLAAAQTRKLDKDVGSEGDLGVAVHTVVKTELTYLDAVGSTLNNPRSPLRSRISGDAIALRQALQNVPGGASRAISGGANLVVYSKLRVGETP